MRFTIGQILVFNSGPTIFTVQKKQRKPFSKASVALWIAVVVLFGFTR